MGHSSSALLCTQFCCSCFACPPTVALSASESAVAVLSLKQRDFTIHRVPLHSTVGRRLHQSKDRDFALDCARIPRIFINHLMSRHRLSVSTLVPLGCGTMTYGLQNSRRRRASKRRKEGESSGKCVVPTRTLQWSHQWIKYVVIYFSFRSF